MALIYTSRGATRSGRASLVPGGLACAAAARRFTVSPALLQLSSTLKLAPGFSRGAVNRLAPNPA